MSPSSTRLALGEALLSCTGDVSCIGRVIAALHVNRLVATDITVAGKSYSITMRLYDGQGQQLTHSDDLCEICTVHEAEEAVTKQAAHLAAAARTFPVEIVAAPVEKEQPVAKAPPPPPPREELPPVTSNTSPMQASPFEPVAAPPRKQLPAETKGQGGFPYRAVGFGSFGAGLVGLAVGIPLVVIDGRPTCNAVNPTTQCKEVFNTAAGGATMLALGAIGLVATIPLLYLDYRDRHRDAPRSTMLFLRGAPTIGGGGLVFGGRF